MQTFKLNEAEEFRYDEFKKQHYSTCNSSISVTFTQTGIAPHIQVECLKCKQIKDISDYTSW